MIRRFLFISLLLISTPSMAQYYQTGVEPFSTKWRQIKTNRFRIIFPLEADKLAFRYANLLSVVDTLAPKSLDANQKCFDIVIHNHSMLSNGFVAWAPKRMEIITQSPSSTQAQPWLTQLAIHETRHTSQLFKLNEGIIKPLSFAFGEQAVGAAAGFVPFWFLEGDAVAFETASSNSGRGRQADFYQYYRTHYLTRTKRFSYDKWLMGSYRDNIPNHYNFGYQLVTYAKLNFGNEVWANTLKYVSHYPFTVFPFYFGLKRQTGLSRKQLFQKAFENLDSLWEATQNDQVRLDYKSLVKGNKEYSDYRYPHLLNDTLLVVYKTSQSKNPRFILVNLLTKKERTIARPANITSIPTYFKENIFWTEYQPHIRWEYKDYSIIRWYSIKTGKIKTISDRGRYSSPIYNPNDNLVYVISSKDNGENILEAFGLNGEKKKSITLPSDYQPFEVFVNSERDYLISCVVSDRGKSIVRVNKDGSCDIIYGPTYLDIHSLSSNGDLIFFSTSKGYKEDLFSLNIITKKIYQLTRSSFGSTDPEYISKTRELVFSNYTDKGYCISTTNVDTTSNDVELKCINDDIITTRLSAAEKGNIDSIAIPNNSYSIEKYRGARTLLNVHSWAPFYFDPNQLIAGDIQIKLGVTVFSQNLTGSSVLNAGYGYDNGSLARVNYSYYGFFPVLSYQFELSAHSPSVYLIKNTALPKTDSQKKESTFNLYLPLKFSSGSFSSLIYPFVKVISTNDYFFSKNDSLYHKGFQRINYRLYLSSLQYQAKKDFRPRIGFIADLNFENAPFNRNNFGSLTAGDITMFLPGIGVNHSILLRSSIQRQNIERYFFPNKINFPRGYTNFPSESFRSISFEYLMPVAYPDISFGSLAYLKRISLNTFYDYARNEYPTRAGKQIDFMKSFGFEIYTDLKFFRTRYPIRFKFQQGWTSDNLLPFNTFTFAIDLYGQ